MTARSRGRADEEDDLEARQRGRYLARRHGLRRDVALALAFRELGWTASGISSKIDVTEATAAGWLDDIAEEYGLRAIETKQPDERTGGLRR